MTVFRHLCFGAILGGLVFPELQASASKETRITFRKELYRGPIDDATCDVEELEEANRSQLYSILLDLKNTTFFRTFAVDLEQKCPLATLRQDKKPSRLPKPSDNNFPQKSNIGKTDSSSSGLGLPGFFGSQEDGSSCTGVVDAEPDAKPACSIESGDDSFTSWQNEESFAKISKTKANAGGPTKNAGNEISTEADVFNSDIVVSEDEDFPCDDEPSDGLLPETFWLDMCSNISEGDGIQHVNLALNPERNTGYNGTHIWKAIYDENCIKLDGRTDEPMCYEERILYRLLSGLHLSTTLSIAKNYYPPNKRKGRLTYEPNLPYFHMKVGQHPDHVRNLHFSYVVLLRALKKANSFLYSYEIRTGNIVDDETAMILLKRLLDSSILKSCNNVFTAFDESMMFQQQSNKLGEKSQEIVSLQQNFKGVFHNISSILDCVQCQQCKLHGKMAMLGYGTALKILFLPREELLSSALSRNEIVALVNTIAKMSEAIMEVRELTQMYQTEHKDPGHEDSTHVENITPIENRSPNPIESIDPFDAAVGAIAALSRDGLISEEQEVKMVKLALSRDEDFLVLAKHFSSNLDKFLLHTSNISSLATTLPSADPDAIVVGTGLAGLTATLNILDRGGRVVLVEKEHLLGGNSNKASSGMNACCPNNNTFGDNAESFKADVVKSAGDLARLPLIEVLVKNSASAVNWLKDRVGVDLSLMAKLGGHQFKRTHRPSNGMVGAEIIYGMQKAVKKYEKSGMVKIMVDTVAKKLIKNDAGRVEGIEVQDLSDVKKEPMRLTSPNVILATGGFAADRSKKSYLAEYRPELLNMPATAGHFSTGDGIRLATDAGATLVDMDRIQIHPTGWVNPSDPKNPNKILAAELMRGVGGILLNKSGQRFCNELGTRAYVTDRMLSHDSGYASSGKWSIENEIPTFSLILSSSAAADGKKHVDHYTHKGLLKKLEGVSELASWMGMNAEIVRNTMKQYQDDSDRGVDQWGKSSFGGVPSRDLETETFYAGTITPVLHYCMGGINIDVEGNVLDENSKPIPGLHAAGEVSGGVHGNNRLAGNSLLECTVFGTIVGKKIPIAKVQSKPKKITTVEKKKMIVPQERKVTQSELSKHNKPDDCWVAIHGNVYDLTAFAEEHPAGPQSIHKLAGLDGTEEFAAIHSESMLDDFKEDLIGIYN